MLVQSVKERTVQTFLVLLGAAGLKLGDDRIDALGHLSVQHPAGDLHKLVDTERSIHRLADNQILEIATEANQMLIRAAGWLLCDDGRDMLFDPIVQFFLLQVGLSLLHHFLVTNALRLDAPPKLMGKERRGENNGNEAEREG